MENTAAILLSPPATPPLQDTSHQQQQQAVENLKTSNAVRQALKRKLENATANDAPSKANGTVGRRVNFVTPNQSDASEDESDLPPRKRQYVRNPDQLESHAALQKQLQQQHQPQKQQQQLCAPTPPPSECSGSEDENTKSGSDEERTYFQTVKPTTTTTTTTAVPLQRESVIMRINKDGSCTKGENNGETAPGEGGFAHVLWLLVFHRDRRCRDLWCRRWR